MTVPRSPDIRFRVDPGDLPPEKAARRLHLTLERFNELHSALRERGFPAPDPDTGMYGIEAIDEWLRTKRGGLSKNAEDWGVQIAVQDDANQPRDLIYVIGFADYVKIGFTKWPLQYRLSAIQTSCPEKLVVYATFPGSSAIEAELHRRFAAYRTHGEWFRRKDALAGWIDLGCK